MKHQITNKRPWLVCPNCQTEMLELFTDEDPGNLFKGSRPLVMVCTYCAQPSIVGVEEQKVYGLSVEELKEICTRNPSLGNQIVALMLQTKAQ